MPPEENKNNNTGLNNFRTGIDPVFKSSSDLQKKPVTPNAPVSVSSLLNNQKYVPNQAPISISLNPNENIQSNPKSIVRTYKGDLESAIQTNHMNSINIAIAENQKMHSQIKAEPEQLSPNTDYSKNKLIIFISVILVIIGVVGVSLAYYYKSPSVTPVAKVQELPSLITTEYKDEINTSVVSKDKFINTLSIKLNDVKIPVNSLYNTYVTTGTSTNRRLIDAFEFATVMNLRMPEIMRRTLLPDFMVGMYSFGKNLPFIIFKTSYFENAYAGMLNWEANLEKDLQLLFRLPGYGDNVGISSQLTPTIAKKFQDAVIVNKDVRLVRGDDGQIILIYAIIDKETIVITTSDTAFKELVDRLNKEKTLKR
jgi:hypothetical protein